MAKIILSLEGSVIREVPLNKDRVTIGRKPTNDIQIENLAVSGEHACIVTILADSFLEDLGSTNGTLVNGNKVTKHILQNNDVIEIGKYKMKYVLEPVSAGAAAQPPAEDFERTMVMRAPPKVAKPAAAPPSAPAAAAAKPAAAPAPAPAAPKPAAAPAPAPVAAKPAAAPAPAPAAPKPAAAPAPAPVAAKPAAPAEAHPMASLQILTGAAAGREIDLTKNLTTLGKPGLQVAVITRRPQGYFITHVEGAAFPAVNGVALDTQARALKDRDVIELAGVKMEFFVKK